MSSFTELDFSNALLSVAKEMGYHTHAQKPTCMYNVINYNEYSNVGKEVMASASWTDEETFKLIKIWGDECNLLLY